MNQAEALFELHQPLHETGSQERCSLRQLFRLNHFESGKRRGTRYRILLMREVSERAIVADIEILPGEQGCDWECASTEALAQNEHIGNNTVLFASKHGSGAAKPVWDFVQNEQRAMPVTCFANGAPVLRWRR